MLRIAVIMIAVIVFLPHTAFSGERAVIGSYQDVTGQVRVLHAGGKDMPAVENESAVYTHDQIETGAKSTVTLHFIDDTSIVMGPNGRMTVGEYVFDPVRPEGTKPVSRFRKRPFPILMASLGRVNIPT